MTLLSLLLTLTLGPAMLPAQQGPVTPSSTALGPPPEPAITDTRPLLHHQLLRDRGAETGWRTWWALNQAPYLDLRQHVRAPRAPDAKTPDSSFQAALWSQPAEHYQGPSATQKELLIRPSLLRLAADSTNRDVHAQVIMALSRLGLVPRDTAVRIRNYLASPSLEIAQTSTLALGVIGAPAGRDELIALLLDDPTGRWLSNRPDGVPASVRAFAAYALGLSAVGSSEVDREENRAILWQLLETADTPVDLRLASVVALGMQAAAEPSANVKQLFALALDEAQDDRIRAQAVTALCRLCAPLAPGAPLVRKVRAQLLSLGTSPSQPALLRQAALQSLGLLAWADQEQAPASLEVLIHAAASAITPMERHFAAISLAYLGAAAEIQAPVRQRAVDGLIAGLADSSVEQRTWSGLALGVMAARAGQWRGKPRTDVDRALLQALTSPGGQEERAAYAIACGLAGHQTAADTLLSWLGEEEDPLLLGHTAIALGLLGDERAVPELQQWLDRAIHQPELLEQIATALALLHNEDTVPLLLRHFDPAFGPAPTLGTLAALTRALGMAGDARTAASLINTMENRHAGPTAKALAADAIGLVADKERLPWQYRLAADLNYLARSESLADPIFGTGVLDR